MMIPIAVFMGLFLLFLGRGTSSKKQHDWICNFLLAAIFWGVIVVVIAELLTFFRAINRAGLSLSWIAVGIILIIVGIRSGAFERAIDRGRGKNYSFGQLELLLLGSLVLVSAILFLIAIIAPPNNVDSFLYHMSRVVHWAQNESLEHYPAYRDHQLNKPIWAETAILHLRVLWGNDRLSNLVQWFSMVGSVLGIAGIAKLLGASRRGQILASTFAISIPMGILQATSTQNDYVTAFWTVCLSYLVVLSTRRSLSKLELFSLMSTFGLGILTKGVFFVYFPPFLLWFFIHILREQGVWRTIVKGILMLAVAVALNIGFWARNIQTYGGPYGTSDWLQRNLGFNVDFLNQLFEGSGEGQSAVPVIVNRPIQNGSPNASWGEPAMIEPGSGGKHASSRLLPMDVKDNGGISNYLISLVQTAGRNFTSPSGFITDGLIGFVEKFPGVFGEDYAQELKASAWNHEDHAGNLHHLGLIVLALVTLPFIARYNRSIVPLIYGLVCTSTFLLLPVVIGHADSIWGIRYQLPFFVLCAPLIALAFSSEGQKWLSAVLTASLIISALPWLLLNNTRPVIGIVPWPTKIESVFIADQGEILMANNPALRDDYSLVSDAIRKAECEEVGLIVDQSFLEYPLWWFLNAPESGTQIRVLVSETDRYPPNPDSFEACAVVCTQCETQESLNNLEIRHSFDTLTVFLEANTRE
jgi:4-amino-4-deoxy-L-arabinose transferase-like glycosyltransferase